MTYVHSEYMKKWRAKRKAKGLPTGGKASSEWWQAYRAEYYADPSVRKQRAENMKRYRNDPMLRSRHIARWLLNKAVKRGDVVKMPCACGNIKVDGHHSDYSKPLEVVWMCRSCHSKYHAKAEDRP